MAGTPQQCKPITVGPIIRVDHENFKDTLREGARLKSAFININSKFHGTQTCIGRV
jgi:hypothetical protein